MDESAVSSAHFSLSADVFDGDKPALEKGRSRDNSSQELPLLTSFFYASSETKPEAEIHVAHVSGRDLELAKGRAGNIG